MERLTSRENALIKEYRKLSASRRHREETGCFVLEGARLVLDAAQSGIALRTLLISDEGERYPETEKLKGWCSVVFPSRKSWRPISPIPNTRRGFLLWEKCRKQNR